MDKQRQINICFGLIGVAVATIAIVAFWRQEAKTLRFHEEQQGFFELGQLAADMIANREEGVVGDDEGTFIASFEDFHRYVSRHRPSVVVARHAQNPFPGLLPGASYAHHGTPATQPTNLLFWSNEIHHRSVDFQFRLRCDGTLHSLISGDGVRMAPTGRTSAR